MNLPRWFPVYYVCLVEIITNVPSIKVRSGKAV